MFCDGRRESPGRQAHLRVITYNIHRAIGVDRRFRPERIVKILQHYDADLVMLQEVDEGVPRSRELNLAKELAEALGYPHFALGHNVSLRGGATATPRSAASRSCASATSTSPCPRAGSGAAASTPASWSRRRKPPLEVFNLHLGLSARERQKQIDLLSRSHEFSGVGEGTPMLVAGDFNDWRSLLWPMFTNGLGFRCATDSQTGRRGALATYPSFSPQGGLDRIYFRGPLRAGVGAAVPAPDLPRGQRPPAGHRRVRPARLSASRTGFGSGMLEADPAARSRERKAHEQRAPLRSPARSSSPAPPGASGALWPCVWPARATP